MFLSWKFVFHLFFGRTQLILSGCKSCKAVVERACVKTIKADLKPKLKWTACTRPNIPEQGPRTRAQNFQTLDQS